MKNKDVILGVIYGAAPFFTLLAATSTDKESHGMFLFFAFLFFLIALVVKIIMDRIEAREERIAAAKREQTEKIENIKNLKQKIAFLKEEIDRYNLSEFMPKNKQVIEKYNIDPYLEMAKYAFEIEDVDNEDEYYLQQKMFVFQKTYSEGKRILSIIDSLLSDIEAVDRKIKSIDVTPLFNRENKVFSFRNIFYDQDFFLECDEVLYSSFQEEKNHNIDFLDKKLFMYNRFLDFKETLQGHYNTACEHGVYGAFLNPIRCKKCKKAFFKFLKYSKTDQEILDEYENIIQKLSPEEIGKRYERYIGYIYEADGYDVDYNGIKKGKKDDGVDIIAKKNREIIIIQCKWYKADSEIHSNTIRQLNDNLQEWTEEHRQKIVKARLYTVYDNLDEQARERLAKTQIEHIVLAYDNNYPKIKCNINDETKEKIYHLPNTGMYDYIKINIRKNQCYAKTIQEAQELGFRPANKRGYAVRI